jgi:hypothetical protein
MEELHKNSLSILRHPDSALAHSFRCVRDLSSIRVKDSLCCHLSSSLLLCAWVCCDLCLVCVAHTNLTSCFHCDLCCKGECWGPSASEGPQKHDLIMFSKYTSRHLRNQVTGAGIFGIRFRVYKSMVKMKLDWEGRRS